MASHGSRVGRARSGAVVLATILSAVVAFLGITPSALAAGGTGTVSGTVFAWNGGSYVHVGGGASLRAYPLHSDGTDAFGAVTNLADGTYQFTLAPGTYRIVAYQYSFPDSARSTYYGDTVREYEAQIVTVAAGDVLTGYDITAPKGTSLSGTVSFTGGVVGASILAALFDPVSGEFEFSRRTTTNGDGSYTLRGLVPGSYLLRFGDIYDDAATSTEYWNGEMYIADATLVTVGTDPLLGYDGEVGPGGFYVARISGADRFEAAANVSLGFAAEAPVPAVFIVNGLNYPDALSAGAAAAELGGPVLLVTPGDIPDIVDAALALLEPLEIHIVGGPNSVSATVEAELAGYAPVTRHGGADRYEASRNLADAIFGAAGVRTVYLANGRNFPDALSAGPAAANQGAPVVLVNGGLDEIDTATADLIQSLGATRVMIAGGPNSVSEGIRHSLADVPGVIEVYRRWGDDRYTASVDVAQGSFAVADAVFLAVGTKFPDALAGGALAAHWRAPLLLAQPDCIPPEAAELILRLKPREIYVLGGPASLAPSVMDLTVCAG